MITTSIAKLKICEEKKPAKNSKTQARKTARKGVKRRLTN